MYSEAPFISDGCELFMLLTFECQRLLQQFQLFRFKLSKFFSHYQNQLALLHISWKKSYWSVAVPRFMKYMYIKFCNFKTYHFIFHTFAIKSQTQSKRSALILFEKETVWLLNTRVYMALKINSEFSYRIATREGRKGKTKSLLFYLLIFLPLNV